MGPPGINKKQGSSKSFALFVLLSALSISSVAAYYSIVGLMAIFSGAAFEIAIMGSVLEVGKLVAASWLYKNWKEAPFLMKSYMTMGVVTLMFITSMGIFGFLSKAHLEHVGPQGNNQAKVEKYDFDIKQQEKRIERSQHILGQFDSALEAYFEMKYVTRGLKERAKQAPEREALQLEIEDANQKIDALTVQKFEAQKEIRGIEAEVGPIKYIAQVIYGDNLAGSQDLDKTVRWMIILLISVFDPMAVLLVIAGNMSLSSNSGFKTPGPAGSNLNSVTARHPISVDLLKSKEGPSSTSSPRPAPFDNPPLEIIQDFEEPKTVEPSPGGLEVLKTGVQPSSAVSGVQPSSAVSAPVFKTIQQLEAGEGPSPPPSRRSIDEIVQEICNNAKLPFNLNDQAGAEFKKQLVTGLKKNQF